MDIRNQFLKFFEEKGHKIYPSSPLVPEDPTLLFTNAGMVQFKPIFTGEQPAPNPPRACSSQLCLRAGGKHNDLENVGYTNRHHTLFEMLGNFSFGDYFKEKAIEYAWEFVTEVLKLPVDRLWISVHEKDREAEELWKRFVPADRIVKMGDKDNFWQMGETGPCGYCSEIHYDQGADKFNGPEDYLGGEGDRFLEIWNLVFMEFNRDASGKLTPLPKPSIDTGMGLERITAVKEGVPSNYETSIFRPLIKGVEELTGRPYSPGVEGASHRVIADHLRAVTFLTAQGVQFSNEGRGYVLRRILRRGVRHGYKLGLKEPFLYRLVDLLVEQMGGHYPYLKEEQERVKEVVKAEEERFFETLERGMKLFQEELARSTGPKFSGEVAFKLYDTFGFPVDLTQDMLREVGKEVDFAQFQKLMEEQRERARAHWKGSGAKGWHLKGLEGLPVNRFVGYTQLRGESKVLGLFNREGEQVSRLEGEGFILLEETPFYAESGGQIGDRGKLYRGEEEIGEVLDTQKVGEWNVSKVVLKKPVEVGEKVVAEVDSIRREIAKHHSATHLLHSALRQVLGDGVAQAGSLVTGERLRFDFTYPKPLTQAQLEEVEGLVNRVIAEGIEGEVLEMGLEEAKKIGAIALFGEKYRDKVRVVKFGEFSIELCGGTHVRNTGEIGVFYITKESGVSAGVRRIEAVAGLSGYRYGKGYRDLVEGLKREFKAKDLRKLIEGEREEVRKLRKQIKELEERAVGGIEPVEKGGLKFIIHRLDRVNLREVAGKLKGKVGEGVIFLAGENNGKVQLVALSTTDKFNAGELIRKFAPIVEGKGGGKADFAQGGGKNPEKIDQLLSAVKTHLLGES
jgi:alanyl-tRNA synthetase